MLYESCDYKQFASYLNFLLLISQSTASSDIREAFNSVDIYMQHQSPVLKPKSSTNLSEQLKILEACNY